MGGGAFVVSAFVHSLALSLATLGCKVPGLGGAAAVDGNDPAGSSLFRAVMEGEITLGHEMARALPGRGEVCLRLNVSPARTYFLQQVRP